MEAHDEKDNTLESYVAKDPKAAEIALDWINNCPGAIIHFPEEYPNTKFFFSEAEIDQFVYFLYHPKRIAYFFRKAREESFWEELLNWSASVGEDEVDHEIWKLLRKMIVREFGASYPGDDK